MHTRWLFGVAAAALMVFGAGHSHAQVLAGQVLAGQVTSAEEGAMEGVVVSAKKAGSNITVSVVTNAQGRFTFPAARLDAGEYKISARANGYDLEGPNAATIATGQGTVDLKMRKARNLARQLTNAEWMASAPGTDDDKANFLNCISCHTLERVFKSTYNADELVNVISRMNGYAQVSQPIKPQRRVDQARAGNPERFRKAAEYISSVNLSSSQDWQFELKTMPRVKGRGTNVVITEYDLPRPTIEPHDVVIKDGTVWYTNFGEQFLGRLDPKTGQHTEYPVPTLKAGFPNGSLDLGIDKEGKLWLGMMYQASIAKFDPETEKFRLWQLPAERNKDNSQLNMVTMSHHVDGKVWINDAGVSTLFRLDLATEKWEELDPLSILPGGRTNYSIYDVRADSQNNVYVTDFQRNYLVKVDAKTLKFTAYQTGTPFSRNRRGRLDEQDRFWFAQYRGNKVTMFDTKYEKVQEYPVPTKHTHPYDVVTDKNGDAWTGGMSTDRVVRLDPKSGQAVEYPLPRNTNMRRMFVDNSTNPPTFWVGSNHGASIVKVEPLD
ncbi:MAG TPA: carboxypeptidase regulatory-like domain-containing protein [Xanthobacteraceae bacterium]|nr:carboxypeptidase regulatory-like domain-containing protein [Xanthobacteraceae bacterium]